MTRKLPPLADRLRAHRREFKLALRLDITPREARLLIDQSEARKCARRAHERLKRLLNRPIPTRTGSPSQTSFEDWDTQHMMRD